MLTLPFKIISAWMAQVFHTQYSNTCDQQWSNCHSSVERVMWQDLQSYNTLNVEKE